MSTKTIAGHELIPGKIIKDHIHIGGTEIKVPHVIISGNSPGPVLLITAGIHNAEIKIHLPYILMLDLALL